MTCYIMWCYVMLCYVILCYDVLRNDILYHLVLCYSSSSLTHLHFLLFILFLFLFSLLLLLLLPFVPLIPPSQLELCPRTMLDIDTVLYLHTPEEWLNYAVTIDSSGLFRSAISGTTYNSV